MEFWTTLIETVGEQSEKAKKCLEGNCTHVTGNYYIFEGDIECLSDDGVVFNEIEEGAVGCLGDLSEKELIAVCEKSFGFSIKV